MRQTPEDSDTKCSAGWENYLQTRTDDDWIVGVSSRTWLHELISIQRQIRLLR